MIFEAMRQIELCHHLLYNDLLICDHQHFTIINRSLQNQYYKRFSLISIRLTGYIIQFLKVLWPSHTTIDEATYISFKMTNCYW